MAARAEFEKGNEVLTKNPSEAIGHFNSAKENRFADAATREKANDQITAAKALMAQSGTDAKTLYKQGREEYRRGDWAAARRDLQAAQDGGYKPGFLEPAPAEMLAN